MYKSDLLTYSRFTHISITDEGFSNLRGPSGVRAMKVPSTSNQPPPSFPKLIPLPEGPGLRTCASEQSFVTFSRTKAISFVPKVKVFELALLIVYPIPSGMLGFLSLGLANELGSISEGEGLTRRSNPQQAPIHPPLVAFSVPHQMSREHCQRRIRSPGSN